ncbi:MAG: integrase core domain-containing protein [Planctomycetota bacterium]
MLIAPQSPWQNPFAERLIGSVRRECLDHVIVFSGAHLLRELSEYFEYYHQSRAHQSLDGKSPVPRETEPPERRAAGARPGRWDAGARWAAPRVSTRGVGTQRPRFN